MFEEIYFIRILSKNDGFHSNFRNMVRKSLLKSFKFIYLFIKNILDASMDFQLDNWMWLRLD